MNDEIQQVNGVSKATNKETQRLSNKLADATKAMVKKNWKTIYVKAVPTGDKAAVRFYYVDNRGQVHKMCIRDRNRIVQVNCEKCPLPTSSV